MTRGRDRLEGRRALVTGASRGIGRAIALAVADAGADVVLVARSEEPLREAAATVALTGRRVVAIPCDVSDPASVERMAAEASAQLGAIEILINNAGLGESHKFLDHPDALWHRMLALNLTSVYLVTKAFVPGMVARKWGRIINVASTAARTGTRYTAAYGAAKHGVLGLTRALAAELGGEGITANAICPGFVDTPMTEESIARIVERTGRSPEEARRALTDMSPQRRLIRPDEVATLAVQLASDQAAGINGQAINVDGGALMS